MEVVWYCVCLSIEWAGPRGMAIDSGRGSGADSWVPEDVGRRAYVAEVDLRMVDVV